MKHRNLVLISLLALTSLLVSCGDSNNSSADFSTEPPPNPEPAKLDVVVSQAYVRVEGKDRVHWSKFNRYGESTQLDDVLDSNVIDEGAVSHYPSEEEAFPQDPSWLPDSTGLVYSVAEAANTYTLYLARADEADPVQLMRTSQGKRVASFRYTLSADGRKVAVCVTFMGDSANRVSLYLVDLALTSRCCGIAAVMAYINPESTTTDVLPKRSYLIRTSAAWYSRITASSRCCSLLPTRVTTH